MKSLLHKIGQKLKKTMPPWSDMIDKSVGVILDEIKKLGLDNNTIVFFTSDNGPSKATIHDIEFFNSNGIYKGGKRDMYEGGIRVPMIVRWPGKIQPNKVSDNIWAFWDFLPTAAEIAGLPLEMEIDGVSVLPTLLGKKQAPLHEYLYWDYGHSRGMFMQAIRWKNWKGIRNGQDAALELYDLNTDPGEEKNLASKESEVVKKLEILLMRPTHPPMIIP